MFSHVRCRIYLSFLQHQIINLHSFLVVVDTVFVRYLCLWLDHVPHSVSATELAHGKGCLPSIGRRCCLRRWVCFATSNHPNHSIFSSSAFWRGVSHPKAPNQTLLWWSITITDCKFDILKISKFLKRFVLRTVPVVLKFLSSVVFLSHRSYQLYNCNFFVAVYFFLMW